MEKKKHGRKWLSWTALALAAAFLAGMPVIFSSGAQSDGINAVVKTAVAESRNISTVLIGGGKLESDGIYNIKIPEEIKLVEFLAANGDIVEEGQAIASIDRVSVMTAITKVQDTLNELSEQIAEAASTNDSQTLVSKPGGRVKKIYAQTGDSVQDVMLRQGSLAVISLDDVMAVNLKSGTELTVGDKVDVVIEGREDKPAVGRVRSNVNGELTITVEDNGYDIGTAAEVFYRNGKSIGRGLLYVYNAWNAVAYSGTVSSVNIREGQLVYENGTLFNIRQSGSSAEYQRAIDKRQKYESLLHELFGLYRSGVVTASCSGIINGIDTGAAYMLRAGEETGARILLLAEISAELKIVTPSLPTGMVGERYNAFLAAARGSETAEGTWNAAGLPAGLELDSESGLITGVPIVAGSFEIIVSFTDNGEDYETANYTLEIARRTEEIPEQYQGFLGRVLIAGGDVIRILQTEESFTITDLENLPNSTAEDSELTVEATYSGQTVVDGNYAAGDALWIILDSEGKLVKAVRIEEEKPDTDNGHGTGRPGAGGFGGGGFSFGGRLPSGTAPVDDGLYSLGRTVVAEVISQERMTVSVTIDELDIAGVYAGQTAQITMNAFSVEPVPAVVKSISNSGENYGGNSKFTVVLELEKSSSMLPGMNATATIALTMDECAVCVPAAAVDRLEGRDVVYTSLNEKTGRPSEPVEVSIGKADADYVEITSGLAGGTRVYYEIYESASAIPAAI